MDQFEITFYYNQPVEEVFRYWATGEGLEAFFIEKARCRAADGLERSPDEAVLAGGSYRWE